MVEALNQKTVIYDHKLCFGQKSKYIFNAKGPLKNSILERSVVHAGEVLIPAGASHTNAYLIQSGEMVCNTLLNGKKLEVTRYGAGSIIGECFLFSESPRALSYEAAVDTSVVVITRQDFEKKIKKLDSTTQNVMKLMAAKIRKFEDSAALNAEKTHDFDEEAMNIVQHLFRNLSDERKPDYEDAMLPHFNRLVRVLRSVQERHRHEDQRRNVEKLRAKLRGDSPEETQLPEEEDIDSFSQAIKNVEEE